MFSDRTTRKTLPYLCAFIVGALIGIGAVIADRLHGVPSTARQAARPIAEQASAAERVQGCEAFNTVFWRLDASSYAGYRKDTVTASALANLAGHDTALAALIGPYLTAANDAYWLPLLNCGNAATTVNYKLSPAVPITSVPKSTIRRVLAHPPTLK